MAATVFNDMEIDAIGEIMNISIGASATAVSTMLGTATNITTPVVSVETRSQFEFHDLEPAVGVEISYVEGLNGRNIMMFSRDDVRVIVGMMMGMEIPPEDFVMDEMNASAIREVMNQMMGSSATALSEFLGYPVNISTPVSFEIPDEKTFKEKYFPSGVKQVVVRFKLEIGDKLSTEFLNIMSVSLAKKLLEPYASSLGSTAADESEEAVEEEGKEKSGEAVEEEGKEESGEEGISKNGDDGAHADDMAADTEPSSADSGGKPLDQAATDALLARLKGDMNESADTKDSEQEPDDADVEEQYRKIRSSNSGNRTLSQSEMDELMKKISGEGQRADEAAETKLQSGGGRASEAENARNTQPQEQVQAQPQPQAQVQTGADAGVQAQAQPQLQAQPQVQPQVQAQPQASAADPVLASILASMQQSQTAMMELIREMHEENKAAEAFRRKAYEAKESAGSDGQNGGAERSGVHKDRIRSLNSPEFSDLAKDGVEQEENREMLMRVPLEISVEVGRTRKPVKDILDLTQGSLVVLDKMAGEQADLYVNGECIARGDIVVVEDNFGIRITEILNKDITRETVK